MNRSRTKPNLHPTLLASSLRIPQLHSELLTRSVLIEKMDRALHYPLTIISAPAGFGKSTLLSQWISVSNFEKLRDRVAWISLESECDLRQFWTYVLSALELIQPGLGITALALLESSQPPIHTIIRILINEISAIADSFFLVLDDYHQVDYPAVHSTLTYFVNHLPNNLHLVIASRSQPPLSLARWRASNQLYELQEKDLRLTLAETATFCNEIKGLNLSPEDITALATRSEGWMAGLQLVALSIQGIDDLSKHRFISAFTGSQRYILDYLVEEVLQRQPENIKNFLLQTSVLERMNGSLCDAVTRQMGGQATLEHLERAHIFTIPLDHTQQWYRYHHLFKEVLYHWLSQKEPAVVLQLHHRAAEWYIQAGQAEEAIGHACAAHEWDLAIELIETVISTAWNRGELRKIIEWLGKLPSRYLDSHPDLSLYYIRVLLHGGQMEAAEQRLREAEAVLRIRPGADSSVETRMLLGTICAFRTLLAAVSAEPANALKLGHDALRLLPSENLAMRAYANNSLGVAHFYLGNMPDAIQALVEGGELARKTGDLFPMLVSASYQAKALMCQGQLREAGQILQQALNQGEIPKQPIQSWIPAASYLCVDFGHLQFEWNHLEDAERYLTEAMELGQQLVFGSATWSAYYTLMRVKLVHGHQEAALEMVQKALHYQRMHSLPVPARLIEAMLARAWLALGQLEEAERWARTHFVAEAPAYVREFESITLARLFLLQDKAGQALALLDQIYHEAISSGRKGHVIEILALTALAQQALGETQPAIDTLHTALKMAEPEGYVRTFVDAGQPMAALLVQARARGIISDYVRRLQAAFSKTDRVAGLSADTSRSPQTAPVQDQLVEPLSQRELEVLQLMANGASNQDIADGLIIAMATAKKHVSNVIQKLGVENRTQAAVKGRNLGLCE